MEAMDSDDARSLDHTTLDALHIRAVRNMQEMRCPVRRSISFDRGGKVQLIRFSTGAANSSLATTSFACAFTEETASSRVSLDASQAFAHE
jgi:hypothetical protein